MAKRSPILGYNHNVRYRGIVFHVQTEDSGIINPHVFSHLFHGGVILTTRKLVYDPDATEEVVKALMQSQHKAVLRDLRRGTFDDKIDLYLAGTVGLLARDASHEGGAVVDGGAAVEAEPPAVIAVEAAPAAAGVEVAPAVEPPAIIESFPPVVEPAPPIVESPVPVAITTQAITAQLPVVFATAHLPTPDAPLAPPAPLVALPEPPPFAPEDAAPLAAGDRESSAPSIEVIEDRAPSIELPRLATPRMDLDLPLATGPAPELDDAPFESITARSLPIGALVTERMAVLGFPDGAVPVPLDSLLPEPDLSEPDLSEPELLDSDLLEPAMPEPAPPEPAPPARTRPTAPPLPPLRPTPQWIEPTAPAAPPSAVELPAAVPVRVEPSRPLSPVRVSFVSARGPTLPLEPLAAEPPAAAVSQVAPARTPPVVDVVPLDAIETPPSGISTFAELAAPLPPPPPLPLRPVQDTTPVHGVPAVRPLGQPSGHDSVPRLAGVPAPTPPLAPVPHAPPPLMAVPAPAQSPYGGHGASPVVRSPGANLPRVVMHASAHEDDERLAAALTESNEVAEIHAPPLPSVTAAPGSQSERPGEYYVTRTRADAPPPPRGPMTPPRTSPSPTRPQVSAPAAGTFRGAPPAASPPPVARPGLPRAATRPPTSLTPAPTPMPAPVPPPRAEPVAPAPRPAPAAARPQPRPRPTTGAGVVVSRPAVIVGAPTQASAAPMAPARPRRARDTGADGMISERSLDEVILAYLSEDNNEE